MSKLKIVIIIILLLMLAFYFMQDKKTVESKLIKQDVVEKSAETLNYKEVFKEERKDAMQELQNIQDLKTIDEESQRLIDEAEQFIKDKSLTLPFQKVSQEDKERMKKLDKELEEVKQQLEELSNEH